MEIEGRKSRRVTIFRVQKRRANTMVNIRQSLKRVIKNNQYVNLKLSRELPYDDYTEEGVTDWLHRNFGIGTWSIWGWRFKGKKYTGKHPYAFLPLITIQVIPLDNGGHTFNVLGKTNISRSGAWRKNIYNRYFEEFEVID